jgi:hypothetical protein
MSYLLSVIIAFPGNIWKQVEWIGWVGHSTGFPLVETGWTGFVRLRVRVVCQRRSLRHQSRRLRCQSARKSVQSIPFFARFYCAVWPQTGWTGFITGWTGFQFVDRPAPPLFLSPSSLLFFSVPFFPADAAYTLFSLSFTLSPLQNPLVPSNLWKFCWRSAYLGFLHHLPRSCWDFCDSNFDRGITIFHFFTRSHSFLIILCIICWVHFSLGACNTYTIFICHEHC